MTSHPPRDVPAIGLVAAGLAAAALSLWTARGCQGGRRWSGLAALLIGAASAPQAAAAGFRAAYAIPDTATAALGVLLAVAVLATVGQTGQPEQFTENPCIIDRRATRLSAPHLQALDPRTMRGTWQNSALVHRP